MRLSFWWLCQINSSAPGIHSRLSKKNRDTLGFSLQRKGYLWSTGFNTVEAVTFGNSTQEIFSCPVSAFTQATFQINSSQPNTVNSQNIVINASINNDANSVRFTAHSTTFHGNSVTNFTMDVADGSVNLYATPFVTGVLRHFIAFQVTYNELPVGSIFVLNQDANAQMVTENSEAFITTES